MPFFLINISGAEYNFWKKKIKLLLLNIINIFFNPLGGHLKTYNAI